MAAHLRSIKRDCDYPGCSRVAAYALMNTYNSVQGYYCGVHASGELKRFQREHEHPERH